MNQDLLSELISALTILPGVGKKSAQRMALYLLDRNKDGASILASILDQAVKDIQRCLSCRMLTSNEICGVCSDTSRDKSSICVVEDVGDLWAMERAAVYRGLYHVLGGTLSALDGRGPEDLYIDRLVRRASTDGTQEVILALSATVDGQTTAYYIDEKLAELPLIITRLAHGMPVGGELDYLDDGTLAQALRARVKLES